MGFFVATSRVTTSNPCTNPMNSTNVHPISPASTRSNGFRSATNLIESEISPIKIYPPSRTTAIPAISYNLLESSSNNGRTPLDILLANPIQFVKASVASPVYKRTQQEAFGVSTFMSIKKVTREKKPPPLTLVTPSSRFEHVEGFQPHVSIELRPSVQEESKATSSIAVDKRLEPTPRVLKSSSVTVDHAVCNGSDIVPPTCCKNITLLDIKEMPSPEATSDITTAFVKTDKPPPSPSALSSDKSKNKKILGTMFPGPPGFLKKTEDEDFSKSIGSTSHNSLKVLMNDKVAILTPKEVPKKRKAADLETSPQTQKSRKDVNNNPATQKKLESTVINEKSSDKHTESLEVNRKSSALQPGFRVKGLKNRMNDCYRNSVLQLFCSSSVFRDEIKTHNSKKCKIRCCVCCGLASLFEGHHYKTQANGRTRTNDAIVDVMKLAKILPKNFRSTRQEDATEYLHAILHSGKDQLTKGQNGDATKNNPIDKAFGGSFPSVLTCPKCKHRSFNKVDSPSLMLQPAVKPGQNKLNNIINLKDLLDEFFIPEKVNATCERCKYNKKKFTKQVEIERLPRFLVLNVMRWTSACLRGGYIRADKIMNRLKYEERITMKEGGKDVYYVLHAVVAHSGRSLSGGHYIAFVRQPDGTWATCNDNYVDQTTWSTVARADGLQASILGYQRVE